MAVTRVSTDGLADSAVNSAKIGVDVITDADLANNSVTVNEISDNAVTTAKIADLGVTHAKLHNTMDLSSKTVTLPSLANLNTTGSVGIGTTSPEYALHVEGSSVSSGGGLAVICATDTSTAYNGTNPGGGITFRGKYNSNGNITNFGTIQGVKENTTDGNYDTTLRFTTRANGGNLTERMRINSSGNVGLGATALSLNAPNLLTIRNSSNGNEADVMLGNQTIRRGYVGINSSETRYFKCISYGSGNMFTGDIKMFINRGGGFNQTQGFRHYNCSIAGYNNTLRGFATDSGDSGTQGVAEIYLGSDEGIYIKVSSSIYGGDVFFTFEGSGSMTWVFNIGTYVTSAP